MIEMALLTGFADEQYFSNAKRELIGIDSEVYRSYVLGEFGNPLPNELWRRFTGKQTFGKVTLTMGWLTSLQQDASAKLFVQALHVLGEAYFDPSVRLLCGFPRIGDLNGTALDTFLPFSDPEQLEKVLKQWGDGQLNSQAEVIFAVFDALDHATAIADLIQLLEDRDRGLAQAVWHSQNLLFGSVMGIGLLLLESLKLIEKVEMRHHPQEARFLNSDLEFKKTALWSLIQNRPLVTPYTLGKKYSMIATALENLPKLSKKQLEAGSESEV